MRERNLLLARTPRHDMMLTTSFVSAWVQLGKEAFELANAGYLEQLRERFHHYRNDNENNRGQN